MPRTNPLRGARVGDILPDSTVDAGHARRLIATVLVMPGDTRIGDYVRELDEHGEDFAAWDGRIEVLDPDGTPEHHVLVVDRYGQVYDTVTATDVESLPDAHALEGWFRFLATACPECGVLDDPRPRDWVP